MVAMSEAVSKRLKELCKERNISYTELAEKSGIPKSKITRLAMGASSNPSFLLIMKICDALEVSLEEFVDTKEFKEVREQSDWR